jgi:hypothetical protein
VPPVECFLLFRWEVLLTSSTEQRFTLDLTRAGPYSHESHQGMLDIRVLDVLIPAAASISDPNSAAVVLHSDLVYLPLLSQSSLHGPIESLPR